MSLLARAGSESPALDAELLMGAALGASRARVVAERRSPLGPAQAAAFAALVERRRRREPVAYLLGEREFWSLDFAVDPRVLVPRPETERLVEVALETIVRSPVLPGARPWRVADVGTGSGAIAVALSVSAPPGSRGTVIAIDRSEDALRVARTNVERHRAESRWPVVALRADLLSAMAPASLDLVVSNPPYLSPAEMEAAPPELGFEPGAALAGGDPDGLGVVRSLVGQAASVLVPGGFLAFEIGAGQGPAALAIFAPETWRDPAIVRDIEGRDRVVVARRDPLA